ncbi:MAG: hypothetical protein GW809_00265 [Bacteroidetes bacterium]|nr:hypothetical protein [Bacteroidota bacterium]
MIHLLKDRVSFITDFVKEAVYFFEAPNEYNEKTKSKAWKAETPALLTEFLEILNKSEDYSAEVLKHEAHTFLEAKGLGFGKLGLPLRLALTGMGAGPELFDVVAMLGKVEVESRIKKAIAELG